MGDETTVVSTSDGTVITLNVNTSTGKAELRMTKDRVGGLIAVMTSEDVAKLSIAVGQLVSLQLANEYMFAEGW